MLTVTTYIIVANNTFLKPHSVFVKIKDFLYNKMNCNALTIGKIFCVYEFKE